MRPRISIRGCVRPYVRPSVNIKEKSAKPHIEPQRTHLIARPGLFFFFIQIVVSTDGHSAPKYHVPKNKKKMLGVVFDLAPNGRHRISENNSINSDSFWFRSRPQKSETHSLVLSTWHLTYYELLFITSTTVSRLLFITSTSVSRQNDSIKTDS